MDSDDWIEPNMMGTMYHLMIEKQVEMVQIRTERNFPNINVPDPCGEEGVYTNHLEDTHCIYRHMFHTDADSLSKITPSLANKIFCTEQIRELALGIPEEIFLVEDGCIVYSLLPFLNKIYISNEVLYHYRQHNTSAINQFLKETYDVSNLDTLKQYLLSFEYIKSQFTGHKDYDYLLAQLLDYTKFFISLQFTSFFPNELREKALNYQFPISALGGKSKIVICCMGAIGQSYAKQLVQLDDIEIVALVDEVKSGTFYQGIEIKSPDELPTLPYQAIVIALNERYKSELFKEKLMTKYQVKPEHIFWEKPLGIADIIFP